MLTDLLSANLFALMLVFARIGAVAMLLPGFSAGYVTPRTRLLFAFALSLALLPVLSAALPPLPGSPLSLGLLIGKEILIGVFIGLTTRILLAALHAAGTFASLFMSLASALIQDPVAESQTSTVAGFFTLAGVVLIFVTDLHHLMIRSMAESYMLMPATAPLPVSDIGEMLTRAFADSFALGLQLAAPFAVIGLVYSVGLGLLGRLLPQLPVFFFGLPIQIAIQIWALALTLSAILLTFQGHVAEGLSPFLNN